MKKITFFYATRLRFLAGSKDYTKMAWRPDVTRGWGVAWQLALSKSNWKFWESVDGPTAKRRRNINRGVEKKCMERTETSLTKLPKKVLRINAKKNGSCHSGPGRTHQTLICLHWLSFIVLANKWTYTLGVAVLIS